MDSPRPAAARSALLLFGGQMLGQIVGGLTRDGVLGRQRGTGLFFGGTAQILRALGCFRPRTRLARHLKDGLASGEFALQLIDGIDQVGLPRIDRAAACEERVFGRFERCLHRL
jgi:hypothetical protein